MKHIHKGGTPQCLIEWIGKSNENWQAEYSNMPKRIKDSVKKALLTEQGWLCCYCECQLSDENSHIEHFRPQCDPTVDPLDFSNMLCSCQNQLKRGEPRHCGHLKENWFDSDLLISPLYPDCEQQFAFTGNGEIKPASATNQAACETITRLGLNVAKLQAMRSKAIEPFLDEILTTKDLRNFANGYLNINANGKFEPFHTTIKYLFAKIVAK